MNHTTLRTMYITTYHELFLKSIDSFSRFGLREGVNGDPEICDTDACVPTGDVLIKGIMDEHILGLREEVSKGQS